MNHVRKCSSIINLSDKVFSNFTPTEIVKDSFKHGAVAAFTSFGIQSSVLLHMISKYSDNTPIIFVDTGYLFPETYQYAETLRKALNLNLYVANPMMSSSRMETLYGKLWESDNLQSHVLYGKLRKREPAETALRQIDPDIILSGLRSNQTTHREKMPIVGVHGERVRILPMLKMTDLDIQTYMVDNNLPPHPLEEKGYVTVGDWHSSRPLNSNETIEDARKTRFGGKFQECGLHIDYEKNDIESYFAQALNILSDTVPHSSGITSRLIKKQQDGVACPKCIQVENKINRSNLSTYIGGVSIATGEDKHGDIIARAFSQTSAPFFIIKEPGKSWRSISTYGEWKTMIQQNYQS